MESLAATHPATHFFIVKSSDDLQLQVSIMIRYLLRTLFKEDKRPDLKLLTLDRDLRERASNFGIEYASDSY